MLVKWICATNQWVRFTHTNNANMMLRAPRLAFCAKYKDGKIVKWQLCLTKEIQESIEKGQTLGAERLFERRPLFCEMNHMSFILE